MLQIVSGHAAMPSAPARLEQNQSALRDDVVCKMRIARGLGQRMPQELADGRERNALGNGHRGKAVAKIVEPDIGKSGLAPDPDPVFSKIDWSLPMQRRKDKLVVGPAVEATQNFDRLRVEINGLRAGLAVG